MELNNYLPPFPRSITCNNIPPKELNEILLHAVLNGLAKQAYLQGWDFEMKSYKATCYMFEIMEVAEKYTKVGQHLKLQLGKIPTVPVM